jgi:hypothetical protein
VDEDSFCRYLIGRDMAEIARTLREAHKDDFFSISVENPLEVAAEIMGKEESGKPRIERSGAGLYLQAAAPELYEVDDEEKKWLARIAEKSDLLKIPIHRGEERENR